MIVVTCHCISFICTTFHPQPSKKNNILLLSPSCCPHLQKILSCDHSQSSHATTQDIVRIGFQVHGTTLTSGLAVLENTTKQHLLLSGVKENATNGGLLLFELVKGDTSDEWLVCQIPVQWM